MAKAKRNANEPSPPAWVSRPREPEAWEGPSRLPPLEAFANSLHLLATVGATLLSPSPAEALDERVLPFARVLTALSLAWKDLEPKESARYPSGRGRPKPARVALAQLEERAGQFLRARRTEYGQGDDLILSRDACSRWLHEHAAGSVRGLYCPLEFALTDDHSAVVPVPVSHEPSDDEVVSAASAFTDAFVNAVDNGYGFFEVRRELPTPSAEKRKQIQAAVAKELRAADPANDSSIDRVWRSALRVAGHPKPRSFGDAARKRRSAAVRKT